MGFVVEIEEQSVALPAEAPGDLLPETEKANVQDGVVDRELARVERVAVELVVVVHVEHDVEALGEQLVDNRFDPREERRVDRERRRRRRMVAPAHRQPHRGEACRGRDVDKLVPHGQGAPGHPHAFLGSLQHVAEVHAAAHRRGRGPGRAGPPGRAGTGHGGKGLDAGARARAHAGRKRAPAIHRNHTDERQRQQGPGD